MLLAAEADGTPSPPWSLKAGGMQLWKMQMTAFISSLLGTHPSLFFEAGFF